MNVTIEGLQALYRAFEGAADRLHRESAAETLHSARVVAGRAKAEALDKRLLDSGNLVRGIDVEAHDTYAYIKDTANRKGYPYPGRYEFGDRPRHFLQPALEKEFDGIVRRFTAIIERSINFAEH